MTERPNNGPAFPKKFPGYPEKRPSLQQGSPSGSKILPLIRPISAPRTRPSSPPIEQLLHRFPAAAAPPYVPIRHCSPFHGGPAPPVTIRTAVPVFSAPPVLCRTRHLTGPPPVHVRPVMPVFAAAPSPRMLTQHKTPLVFMAPAPSPPPANEVLAGESLREQRPATQMMREMKI